MKMNVDMSVSPLLVIWEVTRSCALACRHCRAAAINQRDPRELTLAEGWRLIGDIAGMGTPLLVLTGGDPLQRDDLELLVARGKELGLTVATIPAATPRLTRDRIKNLKAYGLDQMALSLDASTAAKHDDFRRVPGTFDKSIEAAGWARELNVPLQINTVMSALNVDDFDNIARLVERLGVVFWEIFFLVPTGRGSILPMCTPQQIEELFAKIYSLSQRVKFHIKVTEGPHYRRYATEQAEKYSTHPARMSVGRVNSGKGFCFVDHVGQVYPSGFLPLARGNVKDVNIATIYRNDPVFCELRNATLLKGRCGVCRYRDVCGGSRARAWATTGDYLAEDPSCAFEPVAA